MPEHGVLRMTERTVLPHRGGKHPHHVEECIDGNAFENLDVAEQVFGHDRRLRGRRLLRRQVHGSHQKQAKRRCLHEPEDRVLPAERHEASRVVRVYTPSARQE